MAEPQRVVTCPTCGYADFAGAFDEAALTGARTRLRGALVEVDRKIAEIQRVSPDGGHTAIYAEEAREIIAAALESSDGI